MAGTRKQPLVAFILALIVSISIAAQTPKAPHATSKKSQTEKTAQANDAEQSSESKDEEAEEVNLVVPPAPNIIKKDEGSISIPVEEVESDTKYKVKTVVATSVTVNSRYGYRRDPFTRRSKFHSGVDLKARWGDPIGASLPGKVQSARWHRGYGNLVIVDHGGGITTYYAHLSSFEVEEGEMVERGTVVGYAGRTGRATSPHLHYELRLEGNPINPLRPLAIDASSDFFEKSKSDDDKTEPTVKPK